MPPVAIIAAGVGLAGGAAAGSYFAGKKQADAQGRAAEAQLDEAQRTRELALSYAKPSLQEIQAIENQIRLSERTLGLQNAALQRDQSLVEAIDPNIMEVSKQALALLQGRDARTLDPVRRQRQNQRDQLTNNLRAQLGPGFETSTAGIQALSRFDEETANVLAGAQESATQNLLGLSLRSRPDMLGNINRSASLLGEMNQSVFAANNALSNRNVAAITQTPITPFAGAPFVSQIGQAQNSSNLYSNIGRIGETVAGAGISGALSGASGGGAALSGGGYAAPNPNRYSLGDYRF